MTVELAEIQALVAESTHPCSVPRTCAALGAVCVCAARALTCDGVDTNEAVVRIARSCPPKRLLPPVFSWFFGTVMLSDGGLAAGEEDTLDDQRAKGSRARGGTRRRSSPGSMRIWSDGPLQRCHASTHRCNGYGSAVTVRK